MVQIAGTYKLEKDENVVEYLTAVGVPEDKMKLVLTPGITIDVTVEDNKYTFKASTNVGTTLILDEEVEEKIPLGPTMKSTVKLEGNKLFVNSTFPDGRTGTRTYEFTNEGLNVTMTAGDLEAKRCFVRV